MNRYGKPGLRRAAHAGFTLIELMVVLAIMALMAVYAAQRLREAYNESQAKAAADNIAVVGQAVQAYIGANSGTLIAVQDVTIAQLQTANVLPTTFVGSTPWGSDYNIRIRRTAGGPPYQYEALVITTTPWTINGSTRIDLVGSAVRKIGGAGGMTYDTTGPVGNGGTWGPLPVASYPSGNVAGKLAYFVSQATNPNDIVYLRRDGAFPMTGNLQMGGQNITGANGVTAAGTITAGGNITATGNVGGDTMTSSNTIVAGGLVTAGGVSTAGAVNAGTVTASGTVTGGTLTSNGNVNVGAGASLVSAGRLHIQANENLYLQPWTNPSGSPTIVGGGGGSGNLTLGGTSSNLSVGGTATVTNDLVISTLSTRANAPTTTSVKALLPKLVEMNNYLVSAHGQAVPVPTCTSGGTPNVFILPHVGTGTAVGGRWGLSIRMLGPSGGNWTVEALDGNLLTVPNANTPNFAAIVRVFCTY